MEQPEPEREPRLFLQLTESQARAIAQFDLSAIRDVVVECARFMVDCEWGGLIKYTGEAVEPPKKRVRKSA